MINAYIDHTLLKPEATGAQIEALCREAAEYRFASVCVNPVHVAPARRLLEDSTVAVCTVIGFPLGATETDVKVYEAARAVESGADELDMVIPIGALKAGDHEAVRRDIAAVVEAAQGRLVKVIFECCLLSDEEKRIACRLSRDAGARFVKTSTGFSTGGATLSDVRLMREEVAEDLGVKAAGGIRTYEDAIAMLRAGATRIGTSAGVQIVLAEKANS